MKLHFYGTTKITDRNGKTSSRETDYTLEVSSDQIGAILAILGIELPEDQE